MSSTYGRTLAAAIAFTLCTTALACTQRKPHLRREYSNAAALALDALQKASQFRASADDVFAPRKADLVGDDAALQLVTRADDPVESRISAQIERCDQSLRSYRANLARRDLQITDQSADIVDTCIATARKLFADAQ